MTSAVDTPWANSRGSDENSGGGSNANSGGQSRSASRAVDLDPPPAERTSTGVTTGFGGPAAPPAVEGSSDATTRRRSSTRYHPHDLRRYGPSQLLPIQESVRVHLNTRVTAVGGGSKHSGKQSIFTVGEVLIIKYLSEFSYTDARQEIQDIPEVAFREIPLFSSIFRWVDALGSSTPTGKVVLPLKA
jgi:hypothetical protein